MLCITPGGISGINYDFDNLAVIKRSSPAIKTFASNIDRQAEIFLLGNIKPLAKLCFHTIASLVGVVTTILSAGRVKYTKELAKEGTKIPGYLLKAIPIFGNRLAARENTRNYENMVREVFIGQTNENLNTALDDLIFELTKNKITCSEEEEEVINNLNIPKNQRYRVDALRKLIAESIVHPENWTVKWSVSPQKVMAKNFT